MRPLNDRMAEAMRRERLGFTLPLWADWPEADKTEWHSRADHLIRLCKEVGVFVAIEKEMKRGKA